MTKRALRDERTRFAGGSERGVRLAPHIKLVFIFVRGAKAQPFIEASCRIDFHDAKCDGFAVSLCLIDDDLHHPGANSAAMKRGVQIELAQKNGISSRPRLQPTHIVTCTRDDSSLVESPLACKLFGLPLLIPAE